MSAGYPKTRAEALTGMACTAASWPADLRGKRADVMRHIPDGWTGIKLYGDEHTQLTSLSLTGQNTSNTDSGVIYWTLTNTGTVRTFSGYSDSDKTALVIQGTLDGDGSITLTAQNDSGLTGSVTVAYTIDDEDSNNIIDCKTVAICLENLRSDAWEMVRDLLIKNGNFPDQKVEYFDAIVDNSALKNAELFAGLAILYGQIWEGESDSKWNGLKREFESKFTHAMESLIIQVDLDTLSEVEEDDENDVPTFTNTYMRFTG